MILARISELLLEDGFAETGPRIYVKPWGQSWSGWLAVDPGRFTLGPVVGVFNEDFLDAQSRALKKLGGPSGRSSNGPPFIMINLQQLAERDPDSRSRITWRFTGEELQPSVADDVVYCFRKSAYPYIDAHTSLEALWTAVADEGRASAGFFLHLPLLLIKLGRRDELRQLIAKYETRPIAVDREPTYGQYVRTLLELEQMEI